MQSTAKMEQSESFSVWRSGDKNGDGLQMMLCRIAEKKSFLKADYFLGIYGVKFSTISSKLLLLNVVLQVCVSLFGADELPSLVQTD